MKLHASGRRFFCSFCGKWYRTEHEMLDHQQNCLAQMHGQQVPTDKPLRYQCSYCDKMFHHRRDKVRFLAFSSVSYKNFLFVEYSRTCSHWRTSVFLWLLPQRIHAVAGVDDSHSHAYWRTSVYVRHLWKRFSRQVRENILRLLGRQVLEGLTISVFWVMKPAMSASEKCAAGTAPPPR